MDEVATGNNAARGRCWVRGSQILGGSSEREVVEVDKTISPSRLLSCTESPEGCDPEKKTPDGLDRQADLHERAHRRLIDNGQEPQDVARWLAAQRGVREVAASRSGLRFRVENSLATQIYRYQPGPDGESGSQGSQTLSPQSPSRKRSPASTFCRQTRRRLVRSPSPTNGCP